MWVEEGVGIEPQRLGLILSLAGEPRSVIRCIQVSHSGLVQNRAPKFGRGDGGWGSREDPAARAVSGDRFVRRKAQNCATF